MAPARSRDGRARAGKQFGMTSLVASLVIGGLLLLGTPIAATAQASVAGISAADRDDYARKAAAELRDWQRKLHDFRERAPTGGTAARAAAETDLTNAWTDIEAASDRLQTMGAAGWESAQAAFEKAS